MNPKTLSDLIEHICSTNYTKEDFETLVIFSEKNDKDKFEGENLAFIGASLEDYPSDFPEERKSNFKVFYTLYGIYRFFMDDEWTTADCIDAANDIE